MLKKSIHVHIKENIIFISHSIGLSTPKSRLTYENFVEVFEEGRKEQYPVGPEDVEYPAATFEHLSDSEAEAKLKAKISKQQDVLQKVCETIYCINMSRLLKQDKQFLQYCGLLSF